MGARRFTRTIEEMREMAAERGGRCLSEVYLGSIAHLEWECAEGHRWRAVPNNVRRGGWCPVCARHRQGGNAYSVTIDSLREVALSRGGECLETKYLGAFVRHRWRCAEGHTWDAIADSVRRGSWCPTCSARAHAHSLEEIRAWAASRGWTCLSDHYETCMTKLEWECERGHRWEAPLNYVQTHACPHCQDENRRATGLADCQAIAASRGGKCLSTEFMGTHLFLEWECAQGHRWSTRVAAIKAGTWCPTCNNLRRRTSIEEMQERALARGGVCLSEIYDTNKTKLRWRCHAGHEWEAVPTSIKAGTWCPVCANQNPPSYSIDDMIEIAAGHGGKCLSAAYHNNRAPLLWECSEGHRWHAPFRRIRRRFRCPECAARGKYRLPGEDQLRATALVCGRRRRSRDELVSDLLRIVAERGGRCSTSDFENRESKVRFECALGHAWQTRVGAILDGHWCRACGRRNMEAAYRERFGLLELDDADEVAHWAEARGLAFVQEGKPRLGRQDFFRCAVGHLWEVSRANSKFGSWCPLCGTRGENMGLGRGVR